MSPRSDHDWPTPRWPLVYAPGGTAVARASDANLRSGLERPTPSDSPVAPAAPHPDLVPWTVSGDLPPESRTWLGRLMSVVAGVVAGALLYAALATGLAPGWLALLLLGGLLVAVPSAQELSRRVALNGACLLGWSPVLWWVDLGRVIDRGALVLAVGTAALVIMVVGSVDRRARIRAMRPVARTVDALPVLGGLAALALSWTWAFPGTPKNALR